MSRSDGTTKPILRPRASLSTESRARSIVPRDAPRPQCPERPSHPEWPLQLRPTAALWNSVIAASHARVDTAGARRLPEPDVAACLRIPAGQLAATHPWSIAAVPLRQAYPQLGQHHGSRCLQPRASREIFNALSDGNIQSVTMTCSSGRLRSNRCAPYPTIPTWNFPGSGSC